ncbi:MULTISPECIES: helix-turn-helix transcriptional regulator [Xanthomonas]|uniref:AlpA family transcriptional regulator n=1 Tax=Xanthomonas prunicola TaxID=2053930 RepID=A0A9Q9J0H1_9XANT|nr:MULTISPECIES: AlpA family transcriptional regulator [Xanthomonas]UXA66064.1 AlpA family transcriptional regulator [Xanthomonas prunicola]
MSTTPTNTQRLLRLPDVLDRVGMSKSTLYSRIRDKTFPQPLHLGTSSVWVESEVTEWINDQIALRDKAA